jgi:hypothetical protein
LLERERVLMTVAYGLFFPWIDIPDYWETGEVEPIGVARSQARSFEEWRE